MSDDDPLLDELVRSVRGATKYRHLSADVVRRVGARELASRRSPADAVKATKGKLHQVAAAYIPAAIDYKAALATLQRSAGDREALRAACRDLMAGHVSTRERLPVLEQFYAETLAGLAPRVVLDVACGLNPLAIPWMPLGPAARVPSCVPRRAR